jgi:hypothetical protein
LAGDGSTFAIGGWVSLQPNRDKDPRTRIEAKTGVFLDKIFLDKRVNLEMRIIGYLLKK